MKRIVVVQWIVIALLIGALAAPMIFAQSAGFGEWEIVSQTDTQIVLEREAPTPTATSTSEPTATGTATNTPTSTATSTATSIATSTATSIATNTPTATQTSGFNLVYSTSSNRSNPQPLSGATVSGSIYVFTTPVAGVNDVEFFLNGDDFSFEGNPPFDFAGGNTSTANPWETDEESNGSHTITADLIMDGGGVTTISATFTVNNGGDGGGGTPTATPAPTATPDDDPNVSDIELIQTYESVSVYAPYSGSATSVLVEYRELGGDWRRGHDLLVVGDEARGSLVGLEPNTAYEVRVGAETAMVTTWANTPPMGSGTTYYVDDNGSNSNPGTETQPFQTISAATSLVNPGDTILVRAGTYGAFSINRSGSPTAYINIANYPNEQPVIQGGSSGTLVTVAAQYVRIAGFEIVGGSKGIQVNAPSRFVVIDGNYIHDVNYAGDTNGPVTLGDTFSSQNSVKNITVQNNVVYAAPDDPSQSAIYVKGTSGGHVIRNNEVYFTHDGRDGVHGSDCFGGGPNFQPHGGFHRDTDVYDNYCEGATDDAISADGGGMNVRIWGNVSVNTQTGLSIAPVILGPVYYFDNVTYNQEVHWIDKCLGVKTGEDSDGTSYLYHNVWVSTDAAQCAGKIHGFSNDGGGATGNVIFVNNILQVTARIYSGSSVRGDYNLHYSDKSGSYSHPLYNCCSSSAGSLEEFQSGTGRDVHSLWGTATFTGTEYRLANGSLGIDAGVVIHGFNAPDAPWPYAGSAPDMGRLE